MLHQFKRSLTFFVFLDCDHQVMNLGFLVDGSAAVELSGKGNFNKSLVFVSKLLGSFDVSKNATRPGLVVFSEDPHLVFNFSLYETLSDVMASTQMASFPGLGRKTGKALNFVRRNLFAESVVKNKSNYLIFLSNGASYDFVKTPARLLREQNVTIFSIGIGNNNDVEQLKEIAGDNRTRLYQTNYRELDGLHKKLKQEICRCESYNDFRSTLPPTTFHLRKDKVIALTWIANSSFKTSSKVPILELF